MLQQHLPVQFILLPCHSTSRLAADAGASIIHIHTRDPVTGMPTADPAVFGEILSGIKNKCNAVICTTTGGGFGMDVEQRVSVVKTYSPELASLNAGSLNFALFPILDKIKEFKHDWEPQYLAMSEVILPQYCTH